MIYDGIVRHVVFPAAQALIGGGTLSLIQEWERTQWLSPAELRALQLGKLRRMLIHAGLRVPFYRETFRRTGFVPENVTSVDDLAALPILDKTVLRERARDFIAEGVFERMFIARTGGSTGEPLAFPVGNTLRAGAVANMVRCRRWWGIEAGDRSANIWGHSRYIRRRRGDGVRKAASTAKARLLNRIVLSAYDLSDGSMSRYWERIMVFRPAFVIGYATSLYTFADFIARRRLDGGALGLKAVISTAEVLYDWQEEVISAAFGAPVVNEYGMCEAGILAYQCPEGSMHCMDESCLIEILPIAGCESGDIVVTELDNLAAPLIRYNTKDMARRMDGRCSCGRGLSRISRVEGRAYDTVYSCSGEVVAGALLTHVMKSVAKVRKYQILQRSLNDIEVKYMESRPLDSADRDFITGTLKRHLGADVNVTLVRVDDMPVELSGKHRWIRSLIGRSAAAGAETPGEVKETVE